MRFARFLLALFCCGAVPVAGTAAHTLAQQSSSTSAKPGADAQLHKDVLNLLAIDGTKQRLQASVGPMIESGKAQMLQRSSTCNSTFADEWANRMLSAIKVEDFLNVAISVFEKYFTDAEVKQLIRRRVSPTAPPLSPELREKLDKIVPSVQSEILGGCVQVGAKLGAEIGQGIEKEHPEYCNHPAHAQQ